MKMYTWILSVCCLCFCLPAIAAGQKAEQTKLVFAHYMVCFPDYNDGVAGYQHDIADARHYGIDGFVLNAGAWDSMYQDRVAQIFKAARLSKTGFKLFFSADMSGLKAPEIVDMMKTYANHPNYFRYKGRPVLSTFSGQQATGALGSGNAAWWRTNVLSPIKSAGVNVYFVPYFYTDNYDETPSRSELQGNFDGVATDSKGGSYSGWWASCVDGMFYFGVGLPTNNSPGSIIDSSRNFAAVMHNAVNRKTYMAPVLSYYWGRVQDGGGGRRYYEMEGPIGIRAQWNDIIQNQHPEWVELITWNDFNESYISPIYDAYSYWPHFDAEVGKGYYHPHAGLCAINAYYINWYKHYSATQTPPPPGYVDNIYWAYRTVPKAAVEAGDPRGPVTNFRGPVADDIYFVTNLIRPATLQVTTGSEVRNYPLQNGISDVRVPFEVGRQVFKLIRDGAPLITANGEDIVPHCVSKGGQLYNFLYTTGSAHD